MVLLTKVAGAKGVKACCADVVCAVCFQRERSWGAIALFKKYDVVCDDGDAKINAGDGDGDDDNTGSRLAVRGNA